MIDGLVNQIRHHELWFPPTLYKDKDLKIWFSMHSSNIMPQNLYSFTELKTGHFFEIRYNRWKTKLLEWPYKTNCFNYDMDSDNYHRLRSDCIIQCIQEEVNRTCSECRHRDVVQCHNCLIRYRNLWRMDAIKKYNYSDLKLCADVGVTSSTDFELWAEPSEDICISHNSEEADNKCQEKCRPDCLNRYYNFEIRLSEKLTSVTKAAHNEWNKDILVFVAHNQLPDQITEHTEDMSFVDFFGTFGGLFGVWLGLSAVAIFRFCLNRMK